VAGKSNTSSAIIGATLVDGTGAPPLRDAVVVVRGDRIEAVGAHGRVEVPQGAAVVDAEGRHLLPGMIDAHVHVSHPWFSPVSSPGSAEAYSTAVAIHNLRSALQAGITTVRDACGGRANLALRAAIERGIILGPRVFTAGRGLCMTGGHGAGLPGVREVDSPSAVRQAVREERKAGVDFIKLLSSHRTDLPEFSQDEIEAGVDEAHRLGLRVAIHAANLVSVRAAVRAGVDTIEHGSFLDEETAERMAREGIVLVPTLWVKHDLAERLQRRDGPPEGFAGSDPRDIEESAVWFARCVEQLPETMRLARSCGVPIAAGTDFVMADRPWALLPEEVAFLVKLGLTPMEAIESATRMGAMALGQAEELGTVEPGKRADLILVERDPLHDISALRDVVWVMKDGRVIPRSPEWGRRPINPLLVLP